VYCLNNKLEVLTFIYVSDLSYISIEI